jgi:DNA-binding winged helix-turn-helix (wHTH) protein
MKRLVVLIVAQDVGLRARMVRSLHAAGYAVELAENPRRAGEVLAAGGVCAAVIVPDGLGPAGARLVNQARDALGHAVVYSRSAQAFDEHELPRRVAAALAAPTGPADSVVMPAPVLGFAGCTVDLDGRTFLNAGGREVKLTHSEFALLAVFLDSPGRVLSRERLRNAVAGADLESYERSIDMLVSRLRRKIEPDPKRPTLVVTVPGIGYKFAAAVEQPPRPSLAAAEAAPAVSEATAMSRPAERRLAWISMGQNWPNARVGRAIR